MAIGRMWIPIIPLINGRPLLTVVPDDDEADDE